MEKLRSPRAIVLIVLQYLNFGFTFWIIQNLILIQVLIFECCYPLCDSGVCPMLLTLLTCSYYSFNRPVGGSLHSNLEIVNESNSAYDFNYQVQ